MHNIARSEATPNNAALLTYLPFLARRSHAPPLGCNLQVLQDVHLKNGCAFINHTSDPLSSRRCIRLVEKYGVKVWFSGHFHLSHGFEGSLGVNKGCLFVQCGVMGPRSTRDGKRQTRICDLEDGGMVTLRTVNHHEGGEVHVDGVFDTEAGSLTRIRSPNVGEGDDGFLRTYTPQESDGCYSKLDPNTVVER